MAHAAQRGAGAWRRYDLAVVVAAALAGSNPAVAQSVATSTKDNGIAGALAIGNHLKKRAQLLRADANRGARVLLQSDDSAARRQSSFSSTAELQVEVCPVASKMRLVSTCPDH